MTTWSQQLDSGQSFLRSKETCLLFIPFWNSRKNTCAGKVHFSTVTWTEVLMTRAYWDCRRSFCGVASVLYLLCFGVWGGWGQPESESGHGQKARAKYSGNQVTANQSEDNHFMLIWILRLVMFRSLSIGLTNLSAKVNLTRPLGAPPDRGLVESAIRDAASACLKLEFVLAWQLMEFRDPKTFKMI